MLVMSKMAPYSLYSVLLLTHMALVKVVNYAGDGVIFIYLGKSMKNKFLFTMTAYPNLTLTTLGQLCVALWDSQSLPVVIQPGIEPGSVVIPLALRCSALDCCATQEPILGQIHTVVSFCLESKTFLTTSVSSITW